MALLVFAASGIAQSPSAPHDTKPIQFERAAYKNSVLKNALKWKWGREQTGWALYVPLIKRTLPTEFDPESKEFASAVAVWQSSRGIPVTGVVNDRTLFSFINHWQSRRIRPVYEANRDSLLYAPIIDFYDQTRDLSLLMVDREAYFAYKKMVEAARKEFDTGDAQNPDTGIYLKIISSYRSPEYQAELRAKDPSQTRAQLAFRSPHFTGRALDIYVGGEPVSTNDANRALQVKTKAYLWLVENAEKFGFYPYFYEPWHWEYVGGEQNA